MSKPRATPRCGRSPSCDACEPEVQCAHERAGAAAAGCLDSGFAAAGVRGRIDNGRHPDSAGSAESARRRPLPRYPAADLRRCKRRARDSIGGFPAPLPCPREHDTVSVCLLPLGRQAEWEIGARCESAQQAVPRPSCAPPPRTTGSPTLADRFWRVATNGPRQSLLLFHSQRGPTAVAVLLASALDSITISPDVRVSGRAPVCTEALSECSPRRCVLRARSVQVEGAHRALRAIVSSHAAAFSPPPAEQRPGRLDERLLRQVLGEMRITGPAQEEPAHERPVLAVQLLDDVAPRTVSIVTSHADATAAGMVTRLAG